VLFAGAKLWSADALENGQNNNFIALYGINGECSNNGVFLSKIYVG